MMKDRHAVEPGQRVLSVDALRGFDMFLIIGGYGIITGFIKALDVGFLNALLPQTRHVPWAGFHFWDLIMPLFLFIVGVAMPFSLGKRLQRGDTKKQLYFHIIKRAVLLFILGMIAQGNLLEYDLSKLHIYCNTLQAIATGYLIASIIILNMNVVWQIATTVVMLLLFWALMTFVPVPGSQAGNLTPDGNLAIYLDRLILGRFEDGTSYTWIASSITFACTVMMGTMAGHLLRSQKPPTAKVIWLSAAGVGSIVAGWVWGIWFPIIKHLWTSSFVLFSGGICLLLLAAFYLVIDVWGLRKWAFGFVVIGTNAIAVYMATSLFDFRRIGNIFVGGLDKWLGPWNDFVQATAAFAIVWLILYFLYHKKIFIKI